MPGPAPKTTRARRNVPARGDWTHTDDAGWQHGTVPTPPTGLKPVSRDTWQTWFTAWFAAHWGPEDVPVLRQVIRLFDAVERGSANSADRAELRQLLDSYGITKKGQQDRRWSAPKTDTAQPVPVPASSPYSHLRVVNE